MRQQLLCSVAAIAIVAAATGEAGAADLPVRKAPPAEAVRLMDWSGFYAGVNIGIGVSRFTANPNSTGGGDVTNRPVILHGGLHAGRNWQNNTFVYGWEADITGGGLRKTASMNTTNRSIRDAVNLLATLRGRWGMALDNRLLYLTGGLAFTHARYLATSPGGTQNKGAFNKFGGVVGLGAEWKQSPDLSYRLEALYYIFHGKERFGTDHIWDHKFKDALVFRLGATRHF